jgi:hypothetical protein
MNKISASVLAGLLVLGLGACNADASQGGSQIDPPPITTDSSTVSTDRGCTPPTPRHVPCPR